MQQIKVDTDFIPFSKINSKSIMKQNVIHKTTKLLQERMGENKAR